MDISQFLKERDEALLSLDKKMDYKELIKQLRNCKSYKPKYELQRTMLQAAAAIETLLAEREAAVRVLTSVCEDNPDVCQLCKHFPCTEIHRRCIGWEWHGPTPPDRERAEK